jgi:signal transduction histidine kinase
MIARFVGAPVRCAALVLLTLLGFAVTLLTIVAAITVVGIPGYLGGARLMRRLAALSTRWSNVWAGRPVEVPAPDRPPEPKRREDGWYVFDQQVYRSRRVPAVMTELRWLSEDQAFARTWHWLFFAAFVAAPVAAVPVILLAGGVVVAGAGVGIGAWAVPAALAVPVGIALVLAAMLTGPAAVRWYAWCARTLLLEPGEKSWWRRSAVRRWLTGRSASVWHGGGLSGLSFAAFGGFLLGLAAAVASWATLIPVATQFTRNGIVFYRRIVAQWSGVEIEEPYRPYPDPPRLDPDGTYRVGRSLFTDRAKAVRSQRNGWVLGDPATWRDLLWMATAWLPSLIGLVPAVLVSFGFFGLVWQALWWAPWAVPIGLSTGVWVTPWYMWYAVRYVIPAAAAVPDWASVLVGLALTLLGLLLARPLLRLRVRYDRLLLDPTRSARLLQRVRRLTDSRADAVDTQAAELRRIERDLHDGAQARLIAVGLSLATVERLLETDPESARAMLVQARETSSTALVELRQLVRGIHPPVLSERGLVDAVRAIALDSPLPVTVTAQLPGRADAPVESAAYFAVCEALANASRHAGASRVMVDIVYADDRLRLTVTDDGRGGADPDRGSGLAGVRRRLGTFDGVLSVRSPVGGPTVLTMEIPCALSWPRTSTS